MAAGRKEANFSQGWGIATFITALAVGAFVLAGTIKSRAYLGCRPSIGKQKLDTLKARSRSSLEAIKERKLVEHQAQVGG